MAADHQTVELTVQKVTEAKNFRQRSAVWLRKARISTVCVINISRNAGEKT